MQSACKPEQKSGPRERTSAPLQLLLPAPHELRAQHLTASFERSTSREKPRFGVSTRCPSSEIERVRGAYLASGKGDVRRFNDTIAGSGALPIALAERAVMG